MVLIAATSAAFFIFTVSLCLIGHAGLALFFPNGAIKNIWIRYFLAMTLGLSVVITIMVILGTINFFSPAFGKTGKFFMEKWCAAACCPFRTSLFWNQCEHSPCRFVG